MLTSHQLLTTIREVARLLKHSFTPQELASIENYPRKYEAHELAEFKRDLVEAGNSQRIMLLENALPRETFATFLENGEAPIVAFNANDLSPVLIYQDGAKLHQLRLQEDVPTETPVDQAALLHNEKNEIIFFAAFAYENPFGAASSDDKPLSPIRRLIQLLRTERKEIIYILFYAILIGLVSLVLPLGIQTTIELVSGGVVFSSVYVMIGLVILGVILSGVLQIVQISLVEYLQRRIFTRAAFEFAFRIPRLRLESLSKSYAPELVNRFFDIMTIQKGLPKLLIDLSSSCIQILVGLLLISLYHPFFVFFSLLLIAVLGLIFYFTGPRGLQSSILESKYKYKVAHWLEEMARTLQSFKLAGNTDLPIRKTDYLASSYLKNRKNHFNTLVTQYAFIVLFKAAIVGGLLVMGTMLVINRQITLGQFVAAEVIIVLILNAVEKIIMYMDVVYDLLTAVDKVGHVTDLALEPTGGLDFHGPAPKGFNVLLKDVHYRYADESTDQLKGVNLLIAGGERICISGLSGAGKSTLANIIAGLYTNYQGLVLINRYSLRDLDLTHVRDFVAKNVSTEDLFDGTLLDNITVGKASVTAERAMEALDQVGILESVQALPQGLTTPVLSGGKGFSETFIHKLIVARCIAAQPRLLILNDFFYPFSDAAKQDLLQRISKACQHCTVIFVSNDPVIQQASDRVVWLENGLVRAAGPWSEIASQLH